MNKITSDMENIGWHFDNSYTRLPDIMMSKIKPIPVKKPKLVILNSDLSNELGLISKIDSDYLNKTIDKLPLPIINKVQTNDLISFIRRDKKIEAQVLNFVALEKLGKANTTTEVSEDLIEKSFKALK